MGRQFSAAGYSTGGAGSTLACWAVDLSLPSPAFPDGSHGEDVFCKPTLCALYKAQQPERARRCGQPDVATAGKEKQFPLQVLLPSLNGK